MKTTTTSIRIMGALLITLGSTLAATAQTSPPTPQSVAPNYTPPKNDPKYYYQDEIQSRAHTWDFYLAPGVVLFKDTKADNQTLYDRKAHDYRTGNLKFDFDNAFSFGFGFDYNFTEKFAAGAEVFFARPDYEASFYETTGDNAGTTYRIVGEADVCAGNAFIQYNFMSGKFTPFVRGDIGFMYIDTGIPTGPTEWGYWGDYWWDDYYATRDTPTKDDTYLMAGASAGLRYDFNRHVYGTISYTANWIDVHGEWDLNQRIGVTVGWNY
jgi:hypothetical protein